MAYSPNYKGKAAMPSFIEQTKTKISGSASKSNVPLYIGMLFLGAGLILYMRSRSASPAILGAPLTIVPTTDADKSTIENITQALKAAAASGQVYVAPPVPTGGASTPITPTPTNPIVTFTTNESPVSGIIDKAGRFIPSDPNALLTSERVLSSNGEPVGYNPNGLQFSLNSMRAWWNNFFANPVNLTGVKPENLPGSLVLTPEELNLARKLANDPTLPKAPLNYNPLGFASNTGTTTITPLR